MHYASWPALEKLNMKKILYILFAIAVLWFVFLRDNQVSLGPGVFAPNPPKQIKIRSPKIISFKGYSITPLRKFSIKAKILSKRNYSFGRGSDLSPVDLALGWGKMSDESILDFIDISQSSRWYRWKTNNFPIPRKEIETNSANMHLIPSNKSVETLIKRSREGDIIELVGKLVKVKAKDGWHWTSSLTRDDTGNQACELIWVEIFKIHKI